MAVPQAAKRISTLPAMTEEQLIDVQDDKGKALEWAIGVDSLCRSNDTSGNYITGEGKVDAGSVYIPMSRIAMRGSNGLIPASMLPKADFYTMYRNDSNPLVVNDTPSNLPLSTDYVEHSVLDVIVENNRLTKVTGLTPDARYAINVQLDCTPNTLSANIINVSLTCGSVPVIARQMNMAGPATTSVTKLEYVCEFKNGNDTELIVQLSAEEPITVKTTRFTIFELL